MASEASGPFDPEEIERLSREFGERPKPPDPALAAAAADALARDLRAEILALRETVARERAERERAAAAFEALSAAQLATVAMLQEHVRALGSDLAHARARIAETELERDRYARLADALAERSRHAIAAQQIERAPAATIDRDLTEAYAAIDQIARRLAQLRAAAGPPQLAVFRFRGIHGMVPFARDRVFALLRFAGVA